MADKFEHPLSETKLTGRKSTKGVSQRRILASGTGVAVVAATFVAGHTQANTQKPPEPKATSDRNGKFVGKLPRCNRRDADRCSLYTSTLMTSLTIKNVDVTSGLFD